MGLPGEGVKDRDGHVKAHPVRVLCEPCTGQHGLGGRGEGGREGEKSIIVEEIIKDLI